jgi:predicted nuclease of predicted toxin-antitoxin system
MKFLFDAQLPKKISLYINKLGYDSIHTLDLPSKNRSKDKELNEISIKQKRVIVSKDRDFVESLLISDKPYKLLYINTGNITNKELHTLLNKNIQMIVSSFKTSRFIELTIKHVIVHSA